MVKSSINQQFPARPGFGTQGKKIAVYANYFKVAVPAGLSLTRYNVEILPKVEGKKQARVFQLLLGLPEFAGMVTEFKSIIISSEKLNIPDDYTVEIPYLAEGQEEPVCYKQG